MNPMEQDGLRNIFTGGESMNPLINIGIAALLIVYLLVVGHFFIEKMSPFFQGIEDSKKACEAVIFGNTQFAKECEQYLHETGISCFRIETIEQEQMEKIPKAGCIVALDESDYQNLVACGILKEYCKSRRSCAICNEGGNRRIYLENKIKILEREEFSGEKVYRLIKEKKHAS